MKPILFRESQRIKQWWIWLILILSVSPLFIIFGIVMGSPDSSVRGEMPPWALIVIIGIPVLLFLLIGTANLKTEITEDEINFQYFPFQFKRHSISWREVESAEVIKYSPIGDYGGWGLRIGPKGKAFNVSGNMGLEMKVKNMKRPLMIGTNKPEELRQVVESLKNRGRFAERSS